MATRHAAQARHHHDPWPIIEAIRAPSWEIVEAAAGLGISVKGWIEGSTEVLERARFLFPDYSPLKVGPVVLSAGLVCARTEFEMQAMVGRAIPGRSPSSPGSTIVGFWPEGVSAAREHMPSLLRLEAVELQFLGATPGSDSTPSLLSISGLAVSGTKHGARACTPTGRTTRG